MLIGQIGTARSNPDYLAIELMNMLLGGMFSSITGTVQGRIFSSDTQLPPIS
jgi:predicted Zn-dependent peptidase